MTKLCRALFKCENERKTGCDNLLTSLYLTQIIWCVEKDGCIRLEHVLVCVFVLYLLHRCMIINTLMWSLYAFWFQVPNIYLLFFLISLSLISLIYFLIGMTPVIRYLKNLKGLPFVGLVIGQ